MFTPFKLLPSQGECHNKSEFGTLDNLLGHVHGIVDSLAPPVLDKLYHKLAPTWLQLPPIPGKCACNNRCSDPTKCPQFKPSFNINEKVWQLCLFAQNVTDYLVDTTARLQKQQEQIQCLEKRIAYLEGVICQGI